jgi:hypothetical protein
MIRLMAFSGPYAGKVREVPSGLDPQRILMEFVRNDWDWEVNYRQATEEEKFIWGRQDLVARCMRALKRGLPVKFLGREYRGLESAIQLEDDIVSSRRMVTIGRDNQNGVEIAVEGWEQ